MHALRCFSQIYPGAGPGRPKYITGDTLLQETSSSDRKATVTNQMDSNDLEACGKKCCYFWFVFLTSFLDLFIFAYFNATLIDFNAVKSIICIYFVQFPCLYEGEY